MKDLTSITISSIISDIYEVKKYNPDLMGNNGIGSLLLLCYDQKFSGTNHQNKINEIFNTALDSINGINRSITFCNGITGYGWLINHLINENLIEVQINDFMTELDNIAFLAGKSLFKNGNIDFLHGGLGIIFYLLERLEFNVKNRDRIGHLADCFLDYSMSDLKGSFWLDESDFHDHKNKKVVNLGLAHGQASRISILSKLLEHGIGGDRVKTHLYSTINYLLNSMKQNQHESLFSSFIVNDEPDDFSRLSWCYGDLGIACALWKAGDVLQDQNLLKISNNICEHTLKRKTTKETGVLDAGICHGSSGLALMYNRMYMNSDNKIYLEQSKYWIKQTMAMNDKKDGIGGFKSKLPNGSEWVNDSGFLLGASGTALTLLCCQQQTNYTWDSSLLIN